MTEEEVRFRVFEKMSSFPLLYKFEDVVKQAKMADAIASIILFGSDFSAQKILNGSKESSE